MNDLLGFAAGLAAGGILGGVVLMRLRRTAPWDLRDAAICILILVWVSSLLALAGQQLVDGEPSEPPLWLAVAATAAGGLSAAGFALVRARDQPERLGLVGAPPLAWIVALLAVPAFLAVSATWSTLLEGLGQPVDPQEIVARIVADPTAPAAALALLYGALLAPCIEEIVFRGFLLVPLAERFGAPLAVLSTALLFGLLHLSDPLAVVPLTLFGAGLGALRLRWGSLGPPVLLHFGNNTLAFGLALSGLG